MIAACFYLLPIMQEIGERFTLGCKRGTIHGINRCDLISDGRSSVLFTRQEDREGVMGTELCASQLFNACNVLFGPEVGVSVDFLRYLQMPGLKAVYRQKALETHPDRAVALACPPFTLEERFKEINAAYQELQNYLENPGRFKLIDDYSPESNRRPKPQTKKTDASPEIFSRRFFTGTVPKRALLFGQ